MSNPPEICGFYSITGDDRYEETLSSLRYFIEPKLPIDLNKGIDELESKPYHFENMGHILRFILNHRGELLSQTGSMQVSTQYITYKGILRLIMCSNIAPYPWTIIAIKYKGNIYLCEYISLEEKQEKQNISPRLKRIFKYHPMYKHHCLSECPKKTPDISNTSSNKFVCVVKRNLVNRQFLMATQMDGTDSSTPLDRQNFREWKPNQFIGLTLNCELNSQNRLRKFERFKISDTWATCFLAGIERYHIGFRNDFGILTHDRCYSIDELETISKRNWTGSMDGLEFLDYFLSTVETDLKDIDCPYTCMKYHFDEKTKFVSVTKHEGKTEYSSIPEWYLQEIDKQTNLD